MISRTKKIVLVHFLTIVLFTLLISPAQTFAARLWSSGFELGTTTNDVEYNEWVAAGAIDTTTVRTGTYSLKIALTGSSSRRGGYVIPNEYGTVQFYRAYVRFETFPTAANTFMMTGNADATRQIFVKVDNAGQLSLVDEDGSIGTGSTLSLNTWYRLELEINTSGVGATDTVNLYLDGVLDIGSTTRDISKIQDQFYFGGNGNTEGHTTGVWYFDDLAANSNSGSVQNGLPGAGGILHMQPDSAGDAAATLGTFADIDEVTPNDVTDYIEVDTDTGGQQANYNFESWANAGGASNDTITLVQVGTRQTMETAVAGAWTPQIKSQSGGTTLDGTSTSQNDTTWQTNQDSTYRRNHRLTSYTDPQAGGAWTPALLDTAIAGVNVTDGNPDNWFSTIWGLVEYVPSAATTTLGDGTDGSNSTIGPGASATEIDRFSLVTSSGTDTVTGMTVTLAGDASAYTNIATVGVYTTADALKCSATPSANAVALTSCAISVTTTPTDYVVKITPKTHANMPAVPGASYATTATVTAITATNTTAGTDTDSATITVDNASPAGVTSSTATAGDTVVNLAWTNPADADFTTGGTVVVLRRTTSVVTDVPVEGTTYTVGNIINTVNTVACVVTGSPPATTCQDTGLTNGTAYYYKIFTQDSRGNYDAGTVPSGSPATPVAAATTTLGDGTDGSNSTIGPGAPVSGFSYFRPLTIDKTKVPNTNQTDFPVMISGTYPFLKTVANGGKITNASGYDVAFFSDSTLTTQLKHETERYIDTTGEVIYWVKVPTVATATDTVIYMAYGNSSISTDQSDKTNVWTNGYETVWHLEEVVTDEGTSGVHQDSTSNNNDGAQSGNDDVAGKIGLGQIFDGTNDRISNTSLTNTISGDFTLSFWAKWTATASCKRMVDLAQSGSGGTALATCLSPGDVIFLDSGGGPTPEINDGAKNDGIWHLIAVTRSGTTYAFNIDGSQIGTTGGTAPTYSRIFFGSNSSTSYFPMSGDELRIVRGSARSADWITTEYNNQNSPSTFYSVGSENSATEIDRFSLATNTGTDTVTGMTVTLAGDASAYTNVATVDVQTTAGASKCSLTPTSNTVLLTSCAIDVITTPTDYVVKITPKTHANMPAVPGASYATTATVTSITATNSTAGTDTDSATITVDNASPAGVTSSTATAGNTVVDLAWTNPGDSDFTTSGTVVVLRRATSAVADVPVEGTTYTVSNTIGTATVACVVTGSPPATTCQDTSLTNGTAYHYKIFTQDSRGNYDAGTVPTGSPATPVATFSGTLYTDEGTTLMTTGPTVALRVNGGGTYSAVANGSGVYSISNVTVSAGQVVSIFLDTNGGNQANLITRAAGGGNVSGLNLYQNRVIVSHEDAGPITNADLEQFDEQTADEADIMFDVNAGNAVFEDGFKVIVWTGKTYTPGGTITTSPSASSSSTDGDLNIQTSATLDMGTNALSIGGDFVNSGTFSSGSPQVTTFTATATGHSIDNGTGNLDNVVFNGVGGGWSFADASNTISGDITMTAGTLSGTNSITVNGGDVTGDGTINLTGGTFLLDGAGNFGGDTAWTFSSLTFGDGTGATASTTTGTGGITATGVLTIANNQTLNAGSKTWTLSGSGTPLVTTGTLTANTSTFKYTSTSATNVANTTFYNLSLVPAGTVTYTLGTGASQTITVDGVLTIGDGTNALTANANTYNPTLNIKTTLIAVGSTLSAPASLNLSGNLTNNGTFTHNSGTVTLNPGSPYQYSRTITIDKTKVPNTDQTNFPVLISGTYSYLKTTANGGLVQNANGYDVAFFSDSTLTTQLKHETERYIDTTGEVIYWVKVPTVATATDTVIYMAYGNSNVTADQSDSKNVWDSNYKGVWHLDETTGTNLADSGSNGNDLTKLGATEPNSSTGTIGGAQDWDKLNDNAIITQNTSINDISPMTISGWIKPVSSGESNGHILDKANNDASGFRFRTQNSLGSVPYNTARQIGFRVDHSTTDLIIYSEGGVFAFDAWSHIAVTWDGSTTATNAIIYVNGAPVTNYAQRSNASGTRVSDASNTMYLGNRADSSQTFDGDIDEVRISNSVRSADWITTEYNSQNSPSTFYAVGSEVASGTITTIGGASNITFNNFTVSAANGAGKFLKFKAGNTYTFAGAFDVAGQSGNILAVSSDTASSQWTTTFSSTASASYISVKDSACSGGNNVGSTFTIVNLGNNGSCWTANIVSRGGGGGGVEASATPDAQVGTGEGDEGGGTGGTEGGGTPDPGVGGGGAGGGGGDSGFLYGKNNLASVGATDFTVPQLFGYIFSFLRGSKF